MGGRTDESSECVIELSKNDLEFGHKGIKDVASRGRREKKEKEKKLAFRYYLDSSSYMAPRGEFRFYLSVI